MSKNSFDISVFSNILNTVILWNVYLLRHEKNSLEREGSIEAINELLFRLLVSFRPSRGVDDPAWEVHVGMKGLKYLLSWEGEPSVCKHKV